MNKKVIAIVGVGALGLASLVPLSVAAAAATTEESAISTFAQQLAEKLGISQDTVQTALTEIHDAKQAEMQTQINEKIDAAVTSGTITQRQANILKAMGEVKDDLQEVRPVGTREEMESLTQEEREAKFKEFKAEMDQKILDALNAKGLNVTSEELTATKEAARDADLRAGGPGGGHRRGLGIGF